MRLSLVVTTVGRARELERLVDSVLASPVVDRVQLVVTDQSPDGSGHRAVAARTEGVTGTVPQLALTTSRRGVSAGRNAGLAVADGDVVAFPNDNSWYPASTLPGVLDAFATPDPPAGVSAVLVTPDGRPAMLRWPDQPRRVDRGNLHRTVISPGLFLTRAVVDDLGRFDETIGTGSAGRAQAGEETDLVLRLLDAGGRVDFTPHLVVHSDEPRDVGGDAFVAKMRGYGFGNGVLWRRHRLPPTRLALQVARKGVAAPVRWSRGRTDLARADMAFAAGCVRGWIAGAP